MSVKFGHLVDGRLVIPKLPIRHNDMDYFTSDPEIMLTLGQKEVVYNARPETSDKGVYISKFKETDTQLVQGWTFVPYTEEQLRTKYKNKSVKHIRENYSVNDEIKILREYLAYPNSTEAKAAFDAYNAYVEEC